MQSERRFWSRTYLTWSNLSLFRLHKVSIAKRVCYSKIFSQERKCSNRRNSQDSLRQTFLLLQTPALVLTEWEFSVPMVPSRLMNQISKSLKIPQSTIWSVTSMQLLKVLMNAAGNSLCIWTSISWTVCQLLRDATSAKSWFRGPHM